MLGRLQGTLVYKKPPELLLDVQGVGYELFASMNTFYHLPEANSTVCLFIQLIVREDAHTLYAFHDTHERELFRALIKVNGVGPKSALTILSSIAPDEFAAAVMQQDTGRLIKLPGIGKKTAERLVIEMRDRVQHIETPDLHFKPENTASLRADRLAEQEAISALVSLGYKPQEASRALSHIPDRSNLSSEALIRLALKQLV